MSALKFAANLSWLYAELPFLDRFAAAARDGFTGVECMLLHDQPIAEVQARLSDLNLELVLFNAEPGDWAQGERGLASLPGRQADFQRVVREALVRAVALGCPRIHIMAGLPPLGTPEERADAWVRFELNLRWAVEQAQAHGRVLVIEPINPRDMPGYLLTHQAAAHALVQRIGSPHLQVQMDLYHCQIVEGDVTHRLRQWLPTGQVGHLQIAAVPDRGEPDDGELAWSWVFDELQRLNWSGWIGCEYRPRTSTSAGLAWLRRLRATGQAL
ncbi:MAG: TIM barrel protein [Aquabacterium sp.]|jgi:hydroxypyruvate isomerase|uniref:2-oxo-tetronate isomerase n=1 Tax=Aquabacterium sp. TaxID=1872578 RepID=UPI002A367B21|nr:2-oxo-tetronate isomerase [Aquabacterium sp.]MDX9845003.1 TIM barrel protein [Aquabacterium sp.]